MASFCTLVAERRTGMMHAFAIDRHVTSPATQLRLGLAMRYEYVAASVSLIGPVEPCGGRFSDFAQRLRDAAAGLLSTRVFWTKVEIDDIRLEGDPTDPYLVIMLRPADRPDALYGLRAKVSEYHPEETDPGSWAGYIHDEVMEAVDAAPGLPEPSGPVTWVDL